MALWLCLRFEYLSLQSLSREKNTPIAVIQNSRVVSMNQYAASLGVQKGLFASELKGFDPDVQLFERNQMMERKCLEELCLWAYDITPKLNIWYDCLRLEIGNCLKLFGGLENLLCRIEKSIFSMGYDVSYGIAPTASGSWLVSHGRKNINIASSSNLKEQIAPLSIHLLRDFSTTKKKLSLVGLNTFGDIIKTPSHALKIRCEEKFIRFLEHLLGQREEIFADYKPATLFFDQYYFGYGVKDKNQMKFAIKRLLDSFCNFLHNLQINAHQINWSLHGTNSYVKELTINCSAGYANFTTWYLLTTTNLENQTLGAPIESISLECRNLIASRSNNLDLTEIPRSHCPGEDLLDLLSSRLGSESIQRLTCHNEHIPEYTVSTVTSNSKLLSNINLQF